MELGVRDWMIIVGVLLILAVLLDGYRRVRNERRGNIRMSLNKQFLNAAGDDEQEARSSELPNGGARVVGRRSTSTDERIEPAFGGSNLSDDELDLEQSVPLLMESVVSANQSGSFPESKDIEFYESESAVDDGILFTDPGLEDDTDASDKVNEPDETEDYDDLAVAEDDYQEDEPAQSYDGQQEIIVMNVLAKDEPFKGPDLLHILLACDVRYGHMNIFHRHEKANGSGQVQFSIANSVEPGTFDLNAIDDFSTPGVTFFMSVPGPEEPIKAFECMVETAQCLVKNLNGEMRDESRSAMTNQTLEHCRQRLREFERIQLTQNA